jgi:UDP-glucose 4-epimerase
VTSSDMRVKTVLITGASSKFSRPTVTRLLSRTDRVIALTRTSECQIRDPKVAHLKIDLAEGCSIDEPAEYVIHLAGYTPYTGASGCGRSQIYRNNVSAFINVLNYCARFRPRKLVFVSTTDVYPLVNDAEICEQTPTQPNGFYGVCKLICERAAGTYADLFGIPVSILRLGPVFGPEMSHRLSVWKMLKRVSQGETVDLVNPENVLSLLSVEDAARAIALATEAPAGTYNIAGYPLTVEEFLSRAAGAYRTVLTAEKRTDPERRTTLRFDMGSAESFLGWRPSVFDVESVLRLRSDFDEPEPELELEAN